MEFALSELSEQVVAARATKQPLMIRGGGTRLFYGEPLPEINTCTWLEMSTYHGVVSYEPSELVLTARAGTRLTDVEALLSEHGQILAFEPPRFGANSTLGGCVASGLSGPRRMAVGALSDFVLGTRLLRSDGKVMRFGGEVVKNVAGYDVSRLLAGSLGVLGALVEVSIKVIPKPHSETSLMLSLDETGALHQCLRWRSQPIPISATAWLPDDSGGGYLTVRLSGNKSAVRQGMAKIGGEILEDTQARAFWTSLRDQTHPFFEGNPLWRISLPPGIPPIRGTKLQLHEWQGCLRWLAGEHDPAILRAQVQSLGGSATLYHHEGASDRPPVFHPPAPAIMGIHRRLKQELDPARVFNPYRLYLDF